MAATIASLLPQVYNVTRRPDLVAQTTQAIQSATMKLHTRNFYDRDLLESMIDFDACCFTQQFAYGTYIPNWRALRYFKHPRNCWPNQAQAGQVSGGRQYMRNDKELEIITPNNIFTYAGFEKVDVAYLAGSNWNIRSSFAFKQVICGYFIFPNITADGYASWIADLYPFAVVHAAAKLIFQQIGLDAEAQQQERELFDPATGSGWYQIIDANAVTGVGY